MPITTTQEAELKSLTKPAAIYINCRKPDAGAPNKLRANGKPHRVNSVTTSAEVDADFVGMTTGPTTVEYKPTLDTININEARGGVAPIITDEEGTLKFECAVATIENIRMASVGATNTTVVGASTGQPDYKLNEYGGGFDVPEITIVLVTDLGIAALIDATANVQLREVWTLYNCVPSEGFSISFELDKRRTLPVTMKLFPDVTRPLGAQLFQTYVTVDPD